MAKNLLIVESPTKARTLSKYLGSDYKIMASVGHVKDLPNSKLGVDIENDFKPDYVTIKGKGKILKDLKKASKGVDAVYLAPDPDREGEAIAWHIARELKSKDQKVYRVLFNELTAKAIKEALAAPLELNQDRFESQQARRILDRLVGYQISPLLWTKVKGGLSAGRVQSVALRMICEREREIHAFESQEYWSLTSHLEADQPPPFKARLFRYNGGKIDLKSEEETLSIVKEIEGKPFQVEKVSKRKKKKNPPPPYTTSLIQQDAFRRLRFPAKKTMTIAQNLYEGVELGDEGLVGLITYMRTDSFRISQEAVEEARTFIADRMGKEYLPDKPNTYKSPKGAQEAHEAIRPTSVHRNPERVKHFLTKDQFKLYSLIWKRFLASQMKPAILDHTQADIEAGNATFRATGSIMVFKGFTLLYGEEPVETDSKKVTDGSLPPLRKGQTLKLLKLDPAQHFTQPPPRFSEASLIKALEENGIGRPSTYATILSNIRSRDYVGVEKGRFKPTELGFLVTDLLVQSFPEILDIAFTAQMESNLDRVERGEIRWNKVLEKFYNSFEKELETAKNEMKGEKATDIPCPECDRPLVIKSGKNGLFLGCSGFPSCRYTANFTRDEQGKVHIESLPEIGKSEGICDKCGRPMIVKRGKYGPFLACSGYPECKNTRPLNGYNGPKSLNIPCPVEGCSGTLVEKTSKKGRKFYACNQYPKCSFATWDEPYDDGCPQCGTKVLGIKRPKRGDPYLLCRKKGCGFKKALPPA